MTSAVVQRVAIYPLAIRMRHRVSHAQSTRGISEPVVVSVELTNGTMGYGEALPRSYVTCEGVESVVDAIRDVFVPFLLDFHPRSFPEALEAVEALPWQGRAESPLPAARAALELALLDALLRLFRRNVEDVVGWMGMPGFGYPGSIKRVRYSGVLASDSAEQTVRMLRLMYWVGLRHFKLKVGASGDLAKLQAVMGYLKKAINKGKATLRLDANGAWTKDEAIEWLTDAGPIPGVVLEQPLPRGSETELEIVRDLFDTVLMHDESLVTRADAQRLIDLGVADAFNIRIAKCGGLLPSLRLAALARRSNVRIQLGCMVGETSILSGAGVRFLEVCPSVEWAEGCFGSFLLESDVTPHGLRFGYGGKPPRLGKEGLGVTVDPERMRALCEDGPIILNL